MRDLNAYNCNKLYEDVEWSGPGIVGTLVVLAFVDIMVILGNVLVILAVYHTTKLRNVTNMFIVSLAVADLLVGVAVLPFSATWEVFKVWIFGDLWCSVWLAVDVWMCTASILNLCAISLDRYLAVTRPVSYPQIMSPKRAKLLVAAVWVLSFVICFPPLVGWKDQRSNPQRNDVSTLDDSGPYNETRIIVQPKPCPWICELTNDAGYVVYSALGSFYIPTLVMLFFYWRIYNAAVSTTKAINQGFRTTKGSKMLGSRHHHDAHERTTTRTKNQQQQHRLVHRYRSYIFLLAIQAIYSASICLYYHDFKCLRIHRGRGSVYNGGANHSSTSPKSPESNRSASVRKDKIKISVSYPSTETLNTKCNTLERTPSKCSQISVHYNSNGQTLSHLCPSTRGSHLKVGGINRVGSSRRPSRRSSCESQVTGDEVSLRELTPGGEEKPRVMRMGKRNIKAQVKRFRMETKAAKTLGIIVGGFILCWLPFFTMYLVRAFCPKCIHPTVFSVLFWLGYCNSAINPCIYALFSKDFRFAFKRIICNCFCKRKKNSLRRGSDGSQLATRSDRSPNYSNRTQHHGVSIEDSDPEHIVHSGSDSR
ncbi:hypothetical protein G9C98_004028 [Cotesia typhae]|uniref:G-protein coupled receptors family 1 profile domain-containing protein n=1 Tax=Cotesia typhae TaxID=2053667 RepID=A0A8J5UY27_9HYME|nr:hypothetical protein G9C98_004028 [Cotesia typhae]